MAWRTVSSAVGSVDQRKSKMSPPRTNVSAFDAAAWIAAACRGGLGAPGIEVQVGDEDGSRHAECEMEVRLLFRSYQMLRLDEIDKGEEIIRRVGNDGGENIAG